MARSRRSSLPCSITRSPPITEARTYYLEFITTYVGLMDLVGGLPKAESLVDGPQTTADDLAWHGGVPGPKYGQARKRRRYLVSDQRLPRRIEFARSNVSRTESLPSFSPRNSGLSLSHRPRLGAGTCGRASVEPLRPLSEFMAVGARMVKVAAVCLLVLAVFSFVGLYIYENRTLGMLVDSANAKWDVPIEQTGKLRAGRMTLEEGYARIKLNKGAEVILQAPSTFNLHSANRMFLESGWITAKVPPSALGFTVKTPASSVVDFGTEFGLLAGNAGKTEVHVFDGRVELATPAVPTRVSSPQTTG